MRYCEISKDMSSLYFGLDVFCQFEARVPEFDAVFCVQCTLYRAGGGDAHRVTRVLARSAF